MKNDNMTAKRFTDELKRRVKEIKEGKAKGRPAAAVLHDLYARYSRR